MSFSPARVGKIAGRASVFFAVAAALGSYWSAAPVLACESSHAVAGAFGCYDHMFRAAGHDGRATVKFDDFQRAGRLLEQRGRRVKIGHDVFKALADPTHALLLVSRQNQGVSVVSAEIEFIQYPADMLPRSLPSTDLSALTTRLGFSPGMSIRDLTRIFGSVPIWGTGCQGVWSSARSRSGMHVLYHISYASSRSNGIIDDIVLGH